MSANTCPPCRVAVTGVGVVSPLGMGAGETVAALQAGTDAVRGIEAWDVSRCRSKTAGQVSRPGGPDHLHPASRMMIAATREALAGAEGFAPELMVIGTTSGGMTNGEAFYRAQSGDGRPHERARWLANYLPQKAILDAQRACGFSAPMLIVANACASGTNAIGHAWGLIRSGQHRQVLCGGYDALSELVFVGFDSLQASTAEQIRPFDRGRTGLVLGEGAGILALEEWEGARARGSCILAEVSGYGISTDNHHLTQPHPSGIGPRQAMERALTAARRRPEEIGYVNAHGTATIFNDATEGLAIEQLLGSQVPVSSTKGMMGHALGAAGAIEAVFTVLAIRHRFLPPNIHFEECDPAWRLEIVANEARPASVRCALSNSFGFGGTNAAIVLEAA